MRWQRQSLIAQQQAARGGEIAAGAVAADDQPCRIKTQRGGMGLQPQPRIGDIVQRRRERMLRRQAIADGSDDMAAGIGQGPAGAVIDRQRALEPTTAVGEQQGRAQLGAVGCGRIQAHDERMAVARADDVLHDMRYRLGGTLQHGQRLLAQYAQFEQIVWQRLRRHRIDERLQRRFKRHGQPPAGTAAAGRGRRPVLLP